MNDVLVVFALLAPFVAVGVLLSEVISVWLSGRRKADD